MRSNKHNDLFQADIKTVGYVEACVRAAKRDGHPFDEAQTRADATRAMEAMKLRGFSL